MERCITHKKEVNGRCNWCGGAICPLCVQKGKGLKIYCEKCIPRLGVM